jgi:hypothetical protein
MNLLHTMTRLALLILLGSSPTLLLAQARGDDPLSKQQSIGLRLLTGAIDMHFHMDPPTDKTPGALIDNIRAARLLGLRGLVLKSHGESTAGLAYVLGRELPDIAIIGGIVLNRGVGGVNLGAVERIASLKGRPARMIWLPTDDSAAYAKENPRKPVVPLSKNGQLMPEVKEVIAFVARNDLILATGHSSAEDALLVLAEGRAQGLKRMIATHAMELVGKMSMDQIEQAVALGAIVELDFRHLADTGGIQAIKKMGPEHFFISQFWTYQLWPPSPEPFKPIEYGGLEAVGRFVERMHAAGITDEQLDLMVKTTPARLLGLSAE